MAKDTTSLFCQTGEFKFDEQEWFTPNTYCSNFEYPPNKPGVYLLVNPIVNFADKTVSNEILYVGSAKSLAQRYRGHEVLRLLTEVYGYIRFYFLEQSNYRTVEIQLIKAIRPRFNKQHNG
jgi:excinuclease UvrABC nuclease subunit